MSTHTPGPWKAEGYDVRQPSGRYIAHTGPHHTPASEYPRSCRLVDEANARLIARAPQMLADLDNLQAELDALKKDYDDARERHWNTIQGVKEAADKLRSDLLMLRQSNNQPGWKESIDAVSNILP